MQIKLNKLYVDKTLRTIHAAQLRDDCITDKDYFCKVLPVQIGNRKNSLLDTYSLTIEGKYFTNGIKDEKDVIVEISKSIQYDSNSIYILSDLFEQCWISDKSKIRIKLGKDWCDATWEENSLIHIDIPSIQNRCILNKINFFLDQRLSSKNNRLLDVLRNA